MNLKWTQFVVLAAMPAAVTFASTTLTPYNVFVGGNFSESNTDSGGGLAVGGVATLSGFNIADSLLGQAIASYPLSTTFIAAGGMSNGSSTSVAAGDYYFAGTNGTVFPNGGGTKDASDPVNFASSMAQFQSLSSYLGNKPATNGDSCTNSGSNTTCTVTAAGLNIIKVSAANASWFGPNEQVTITGASASDWLVIDIAGTSGFLNPTSININGNFSSGDSTNKVVQDVLFNFNQATTVTISTVMGSILAPLAAVTGSGGQMDGQLVAGSFQQSTSGTEFHNFSYQGTLTPEPTPLALAGLGLIVFTLCHKRRQ